MAKGTSMPPRAIFGSYSMLTPGSPIHQTSEPQSFSAAEIKREEIKRLEELEIQADILVENSINLEKQAMDNILATPLSNLSLPKIPQTTTVISEPLSPANADKMKGGKVIAPTQRRVVVPKPIPNPSDAIFISSKHHHLTIPIVNQENETTSNLKSPKYVNNKEIENKKEKLPPNNANKKIHPLSIEFIPPENDMINFSPTNNKLSQVAIERQLNPSEYIVPEDRVQPSYLFNSVSTDQPPHTHSNIISPMKIKSLPNVKDGIEGLGNVKKFMTTEDKILHAQDLKTILQVAHSEGMKPKKSIITSQLKRLTENPMQKIRNQIKKRMKM